MRTIRYLFAAFACFVVVGVTTAQQSATVVAAQLRVSDTQRIVKEEVVTLTPPACKFSFRIVEGQGLKPETRSLLRGMGYGVKGVPEGFGLPVKCDEVAGSGWIDPAGELQAFIAPAKGWLFERLGTGAKPINGKLHIITKALPFEGKDVEATYVMYAGAPISEYSTRLLNDIGIGIKSASSTVLVSLGDGQKLKGAITAAGVVTLTHDPWPK